MMNIFRSNKIDEKRIKESLSDFYRIINEHFKYDLSKETWVGGGAIASIAQNSMPRDFDVFFISQHALAKFIAVIKVTGAKFTETDNAFDFDIPKIFPKVQFIKVNIGTPDTRVNYFDFHHTMNYYYNGHLEILHPDDILNKHLNFNRYTNNPNGAPARLRKFIKRGYKDCPGCATQILFAINLKKPLVDEYND